MSYQEVLTTYCYINLKTLDLKDLYRIQWHQKVALQIAAKENTPSIIACLPACLRRPHQRGVQVDCDTANMAAVRASHMEASSTAFFFTVSRVPGPSTWVPYVKMKGSHWCPCLMYAPLQYVGKKGSTILSYRLSALFSVSANRYN